MSNSATSRRPGGVPHAQQIRYTPTPSDDATMKRSAPPSDESPAPLISPRIADLGDWRGETLARLRALILAADPDIAEAWKSPDTPVWSHTGVVCTGETYKRAVKLTFARGAALKDPGKLFNASLEGSTRRAIDFHEGEAIDEPALQSLLRAAVALNTAPKKPAAR